MEKSQHGGVINLNEVKGIEIAETVELQVTGKVENGNVEKIEAIETEGISFKEDDERNSSESKIYTVIDNGTYHFRITGSTGRSYITQITVTNAAPIRKDLLTGIADINETGYKMIKVNGKTSEVDETKEITKTEIYTMYVVFNDGDLILKNGSYTKGDSGETAKTIDGLILSGTTWYAGRTEDIDKNTIVLKVNGDLTIETGYTLTSARSGNDVGKGLIIYCTGNLILNGNVDMNYAYCSAERTRCIFA